MIGVGDANSVPRPAISILIVGYNSADFLAAAVGAIAGASRKQVAEICFVNNGTDNSEDLVRALCPLAVVLESRGNIGFGAANNYLADAASGEWLLLLNPDTQLEAGAIDALLAAAEENPEFAILGGLSVDRQGNPLAMSHLRFPRLRRLVRAIAGRANAPLPPSDSADVLAVEAVSGGFLLIRRSAWEALGGFDEQFFLYCEEVDLCRRHHDAGGRVGMVPAARVMHDVGSGKPLAASRILSSARGSATYYRKHFPVWYARACLFAHWAAYAVRFAVGGLASPFSPRLRALSAAMREVTLKPWLWVTGYGQERHTENIGKLRG